MSEELKKWQENASKGIYETNQEKWNISTVWNILTAWQRSERRLSAKLKIAVSALEWYSNEWKNVDYPISDNFVKDAFAEIEKIE